MRKYLEKGYKDNYTASEIKKKWKTNILEFIGKEA